MVNCVTITRMKWYIFVTEKQGTLLLQNNVHFILKFNLIPFAHLSTSFFYLHHIFSLLIKPITMNARKNINEKFACIELLAKSSMRGLQFCVKKKCPEKKVYKSESWWECLILFLCLHVYSVFSTCSWWKPRGGVFPGAAGVEERVFLIIPHIFVSLLVKKIWALDLVSK